MDSFASLAVQAFEDVERVSLLLDRKQAALSRAVRIMAAQSGEESRAEYVKATNEVLRKYEAKREKEGL